MFSHEAGLFSLRVSYVKREMMCIIDVMAIVIEKGH